MDVVFNRVGKRFGQRDALADLSFELQSGEMAFLTGIRVREKHLAAATSPRAGIIGDIAVGGIPLKNKTFSHCEVPARFWRCLSGPPAVE